MSYTIQFRDSSVKVIAVSGISQEQTEKALEWSTFQTWLMKLETQEHLTLIELTIQSIDMFGPNIGFLKFNAKISDDRIPGKFVPGIVFMRGGSVAILYVINGEYALMTVQNRIPQASQNEVEIPAGMLDGNDNFIGVVAKELEEETGEVIKTDCLIPLGFMKPSQGGCDEVVHLYAYECQMSDEKIQELVSRKTGILEEGESITLTVVRLSDIHCVTNDAKALCAAYRFSNMTRMFD